MTLQKPLDFSDPILFTCQVTIKPLDPTVSCDNEITRASMQPHTPGPGSHWSSVHIPSLLVQPGRKGRSDSLSDEKEEVGGRVQEEGKGQHSGE